MSEDFDYSKVEFTTKPFHVVFRSKAGNMRSVLGDLFPDGQIDWVHVATINEQEDPLITCWDYEKGKWVSFYKSSIIAYKELS